MRRNTARFLVLLACAAVIPLFAGCTSRPASRGERIYAEYCQRCHGENGAGGEGLYTLVGRPIWLMPKDSLLRTLAYGASGSATSAHDVRMGMPPIPYTDEEIADVATYVFDAVGKRTVKVTVDDVRAVRAAQQERLRKLREAR